MSMPNHLPGNPYAERPASHATTGTGARPGKRRTEEPMKTYLVTYEGTCRETYMVQAESEAEARENWHQVSINPISSEMMYGEVVHVQEDE